MLCCSCINQTISGLRVEYPKMLPPPVYAVNLCRHKRSGRHQQKSYYNTQSQNTNRNPTHLICHFHLPRTISNDPADASITHCHRHCHRRWLQTLAPHLCQQVGWSMHAPLLATCTAIISRIRRHYGRNQPPVPPPQSLPQDWKEYFDESNHRLCEMPVTSGRRLMALVASD